MAWHVVCVTDMKVKIFNLKLLKYCRSDNIEIENLNLKLLKML